MSTSVFNDYRSPPNARFRQSLQGTASFNYVSYGGPSPAAANDDDLEALVADIAAEEDQTAAEKAAAEKAEAERLERLAEEIANTTKAGKKTDAAADVTPPKEEKKKGKKEKKGKEKKDDWDVVDNTKKTEDTSQATKDAEAAKAAAAKAKADKAAADKAAKKAAAEKAKADKANESKSDGEVCHDPCQRASTTVLPCSPAASPPRCCAVLRGLPTHSVPSNFYFSCDSSDDGRYEVSSHFCLHLVRWSYSCAGSSCRLGRSLR